MCQRVCKLMRIQALEGNRCLRAKSCKCRVEATVVTKSQWHKVKRSSLVIKEKYNTKKFCTNKINKVLFISNLK